MKRPIPVRNTLDLCRIALKWRARATAAYRIAVIIARME